MIKSMTGFGRAEVADASRKFTVEIKSVNHRYLDVNIKLPKTLNFFESAIRSLLKEYIERGKETETLIDATQGRRTKSVIFTENNKIILSALQPETLAGRFNGNTAEDYDDAKE